jgi:site-specific recombinase XerD
MASLYKDKGVYFMNFVFNGKRVRKSTLTSDKVLAKKILEILQGRIASNKFKLDDYEEQNIELTEFYEQYEKYCTVSKRAGSADVDLHALKDFIDFYGANHTLRGVTETDVRGFLADLLKKELKPSTINRKRRAIRTAFSWAMAGDRKWIEKNVVDETKPIVEYEHTPRFIDPNELNALMNVIAADKNQKRGRDYGRYLEFLFNTGCRRSEALGLTWKNVNLFQRFITFEKTKSTKFRSTPMNPHLYDMLMQLRNESPVITPDTRLFPWRDDYATKRFKSYAKEANLSSEIHLHCMRHTTAFALRMSGVDISGIKDMLGHARISTTEIYNRITPEFLRPAANTLDMDKARDANKLLNRETVESKLPVAVKRNKRRKLAV